MADQWTHLARNLQAWRQDVIETLCSITTDSVIYSHFIAINAAVGFAAADDRVVSFRPDNASITVLETNKNRIDLVKRGAEADTRVN
jgi:broad specificity phosphatase PhoE